MWASPFKDEWTSVMIRTGIQHKGTSGTLLGPHLECSNNTFVAMPINEHSVDNDHIGSSEIYKYMKPTLILRSTI